MFYVIVYFKMNIHMLLSFNDKNLVFSVDSQMSHVNTYRANF